MTRRLIETASGFVHSLEKLNGLSDVANNIRLLSDRSLYVLQNLSEMDITFLSRYGTEFTGEFYQPVQPGTAAAGEVETSTDLIRRDLTNMSIEETLECICSQLGSIAAAISAGVNDTTGCEIGTDTDTDSGSPSGPAPSDVNGIPYEAPSAIDERKCKAANYIHGAVVAIVTQLDENSVDTMAFGGLAFVLSVVSATLLGLAAGPVGALVGAVVGAALFMATLIFKDQVDLGDMVADLVADQPGAICALAEAGSAQNARDAYVAHLAGQGMTATAQALIEALIPNNVTNLLFFAWGDSEAAITAATIIYDCSGCEIPLAEWYFDADLEGWTHADTSTGDCADTTSLSWQAPGEMLFEADFCTGTSWCEALSPVLSLVSDGGQRFRWLVGVDGKNASEDVIVSFASSPDEQIFNQTGISDGVRMADVTTVDTITGIKFRWGKQTGDFFRTHDYVLYEDIPVP